MNGELNKVTATLKVVVTGEFYGDEVSEETLRYFVEQDLEDDGFDASVELLKEEEPKQIVRKQGKRENSDGSIDYFAEWYCPHCGKLLNRGFDLPWIEHCYKCGKAVNWNDI